MSNEDIPWWQRVRQAMPADPCTTKLEGCAMNIVDYVSRAGLAALKTLLWSEVSDNGFTFDDLEFDPYDITIDIHMVDFLNQVRDFVKANQVDLAEISPESAGHDFVLTRNHHGVGFWDRGYGDKGDRLTEAAHAYGDVSLYKGDDGKLYLTA